MDGVVSAQSFSVGVGHRRSIALVFLPFATGSSQPVM
jgi:hypothetical protein